MALREAEDVTENAPMDNLPLVVQPLQAEVVSVAGASSDPIAGAGVMETPQNNDTQRPTSWRPSHAVQESLDRRKLFKLRLKHYYQWLRASISPQAQTNQTSTDHIRIQKSTKRPSSSLLYPVSPAQTCDRKSTKHRVSWFLQSPVSSPLLPPR